MGKSSAPAPAPDFAGILAAQTAAQQMQLQNQLGMEQLAWAKEQYAQDKERLAPVLDSFLKTQQQQNDFAAYQQKLWQDNYAPLEKQFVDEASNWASPERQQLVMGQAEADVAQQFEGARQAAEQQLRDYGVDPSSPRYASTDIATRTAQGAAAAAAANNARNQVEMQGLGLQQAAINVGRGYPGAIANTYGTAGNAGNSAVGGTLNTTQTGAQIMGTPTQYMGLSNQALGTWGNMNANNYSNYLEGYKFQNTPQSSGWGSALGLIGGSLASNSAVMTPIMAALADGGPVPSSASPSMGAQVDDIPARLNAGEFIMPREAVSWFGEKAMHDMIIKAQKERTQLEQQSGAVPDVMPARPEAPKLISGPKPVAALPAR